MAHIRPFKALIYNPDAVGDPALVVAPPYDVISEKMQGRLYAAHPNNVVRLILGIINKTDTEKDNRYTRAGKFLDEWLKNGVLIRDGAPSVYAYEQKYLHRGEIMVRLGFIALLQIEDPGGNGVLPHEYTFPKPKQDRLNLISETRTSLSPIFSIFEDADRAVDKLLKRHMDREAPMIDIESEGVGHRLWRMTDTAMISGIQALMAKKQIFIADGHHRYEVALHYRDLMRKKEKPGRARRPYDFTLVYFSSLNSGGMTVLPTHRVVRSISVSGDKKILEGLREYFRVEKTAGKDGLISGMEKAGRERFVFGMYLTGAGYFILHLKDVKTVDAIMTPQDKKYEWKCLDVTVLHRLIFDMVLKVKEKVAKKENILYTKEIDEAVKMVDEGECEAAFLLNPPKIQYITDVARSSDKMPRKTTYFYPKPLSGLVFYKQDYVDNDKCQNPKSK